MLPDLKLHEVLASILLPYLRRTPCVITLQDVNIGALTARFCAKFLETNISDYILARFSSEMAPIEHLWDELGCRMVQQQKLPSTLIELQQALADSRVVWDAQTNQLYHR